MASCLALHMALLLVSGVLVPAVLTGKRHRLLALLPPTSQGQRLPVGPDSQYLQGISPSQEAGCPAVVILGLGGSHSAGW